MLAVASQNQHRALQPLALQFYIAPRSCWGRASAKALDRALPRTTIMTMVGTMTYTMTEVTLLGFRSHGTMGWHFGK